MKVIYNILGQAFNFYKYLYKAKDREDTLTQLNVFKEVPRFFSDEEINEVGKQATLHEIEKIVEMMTKDKRLGPYRWT
jgi:hypothetical protein